MRTRLLTAALLLAFAAPAAAQAPQRLEGAPGVPLALAVETSARADCSVGEAAEMKVVVAPSHGELALREGQLRRRGSNCPAAPGYVVLYVADSDFTGADMVTIQLTGEGRDTLLAFDIDVRGKTSLPPDAT